MLVQVECTVMLSGDDLESLGEFDKPEDIYDGSSIRVTKDGKVVDPGQ